LITRVDSRRYIALLVAVATVMPTLALSGCGKSNDEAAPGGGGMTSTAPMQPAGGTMAPKRGMSTKQKVVLLAGAALLYYLYKKHQASQAQSGQANRQLYQSKNGGIYYRDEQHRAVWVTAPTQGISVPADQVQQYAPDYQRYQGKPVSIPQGVQTVPATQFDPSLLGG